MSGASRSFGAALAAAAVLWICSAGSALALDLVVDTGVDSIVDNPLPGVSFRRCDPLVANDCSLRGAIVRANAVPGPHTITLPAGSYALTIQGANEDAAQFGDLDILQDITINGVSPAVTVITWDAAIPLANRDRIFHVLPSGNLTIRDLSIRLGGRGAGNAELGGGVYSQGTLTVERVSSRLHQQGYGAGLLIQSTGNTVIRSSTINNNTGTYGAGVYAQLDGAATLTIENSTISNNPAAASGGGIYFTSTPAGVATLSNVTVATNSAAVGGGLFSATSGTLVLRNTIVASNTASTSNPNCSGPIGSQKFNLVYDPAGPSDTCGMTALNDDVIQGDPKLGPLQDNGGSTATHALGTGSAALDKGNPAVPGSGGSACLAADQRGLQRTIDGDNDGIARCDIGAAEGGRWLRVDTTVDNNGLQTCDADPNNGNCSLRGAISVANTSAVASVITLPATGPGSPYRLTTTGTPEDANVRGDLDILADITIVGGGATGTIIDGNGTDRVFEMPAPRRLSLQDLTIQNGNAGSDNGGGIWQSSSGTVSLLRVRLRANTATRGGGLYKFSGNLFVFQSVISGNSAASGGGGVYQRDNGGTMAFTDTTIASNTGSGGLFVGTTSTVLLANVTLAANQAPSGTAGILSAGTITARNTLVAGNTGSGGSQNCSVAAITSQGFNLLFGAGSCGFTDGTDRQGQTPALDPKLGPLQMNGGPTETMALLSGSAAIDAGNTAPPGSGGTACSATDQRGLPRPADGDGINGARCDIGAHEATICTTHPRVDVQTQKIGAGQIRTTITASLGALVQLRLGQPRPLQNASVSVQGGPQNITTAQDVTVSGSQVVITVTRQGAPGTSVTVPFQVIDGCTAASPWNSFVGFGSGV